AEAVLRRRAQHRGGRVADHHRHGPGGHRQPHGRRHLRGVQGHRQLRDPPRPEAGGQARLPGHRHQQVGDPQGRAADARERAAPRLGAAQGAQPAVDRGEHGAAARQAVEGEDQPGLPERDVQVEGPLPKLRVGIVNYLNSKPLAWGFLKGHHADLFAPSYHPPAMVARLLGQGNLDIGLIPSIEVQRIPNLRILPDLCVAASHEVRSVILVSRCPLPEIRKVALDQNSRTSVALLRILLRERYGLDPEYLHERPDAERMLSEADAALLIGDPALKVDRERYIVTDLAAEWRELTGLPFVFAVWAVRPEVEIPDLPFYFKSSLRYGLSSVDTLAREAAAELDLDSSEIRAYLTENLSFFLRRDEIAGLEEFYRRAHANQLILEPRPLVFWQ
ncbi:hypothetical protein EHM82_02625, partial [bacterium]